MLDDVILYGSSGGGDDESGGRAGEKAKLTTTMAMTTMVEIRRISFALPEHSL